MRPKHPKTDVNHNIVPDALKELGLVTCDSARLRYTARVRGMQVVALDISSLPGQWDWIIECEGRCLNVEVKQPGQEKDLTDGETTIMDTAGLLVASQMETVKDCILAILERIK